MWGDVEPQLARSSLEARPGVAAAIERVVPVKRPMVQFGVVANEKMYNWKWCVDAGGSLEWIWKEGGVDVKSLGVNPKTSQEPWVSRLNGAEDLDWLLSEFPVEAVLFEGKGPGKNHLVWRNDSVNVVVWFVGNKTCRPPIVSNWVLKVHALDHSSLGGATTRKDKVFIATRVPPGSRDVRFSLLPSSSLGPGQLDRVIDRTVQGRTTIPPPAQITLTLSTSH